jgi:hypothetical protein
LALVVMVALVGMAVLLVAPDFLAGQQYQF